MRTTPLFILQLKPNEIFVFGSNTAGRHGAGAAYDAKKRFGAVTGIGEGPQGQSYAIPTKDRRLNVLSLDTIAGHIYSFIAYAKEHPELTFLVTPVGCGLAKYTALDIAPLFGGAPDNVVLPAQFEEYLTRAK